MLDDESEIDKGKEDEVPEGSKQQHDTLHDSLEGTESFFVDVKNNANAPKIVVADDQQINLEAIKANLMEIGVHQNSHYFVNGQQVIDFVKTTVTHILESTELKEVTRPVHALLLDF